MNDRIFSIFLILMMTTTIFICFESYPVKAAGNTLYVDVNGSGNYTTIQSAINAANPGDTVYVKNGIYYENVLINKTLNLFGENKDMTIINASQIKYTMIISADDVNLTGFTITGSG